MAENCERWPHWEERASRRWAEEQWCGHTWTFSWCSPPSLLLNLVQKLGEETCPPWRPSWQLCCGQIRFKPLTGGQTHRCTKTGLIGKALFILVFTSQNFAAQTTTPQPKYIHTQYTYMTAPRWVFRLWIFSFIVFEFQNCKANRNKKSWHNMILHKLQTGSIY